MKCFTLVYFSLDDDDMQEATAKKTAPRGGKVNATGNKKTKIRKQLMKKPRKEVVPESGE